jgi:hypothetical protein
MSRPRPRRWSDLSRPVQVLTIIGGILQYSLLIAAQLDLHRRPAEEVRGPKSRWRALAFVSFLGPIAYFVWGRRPPALP